MTDRVKVTITGYYDLPDDPALRQLAYDTTSTAECLAIDVKHHPADLLRGCENVSMTLELISGLPGDTDVCVCGNQYRYHLADGTIQATPWTDDTCEGFRPAGGEEQH